MVIGRNDNDLQYKLKLLALTLGRSFAGAHKATLNIGVNSPIANVFCSDYDRFHFNSIPNTTFNFIIFSTCFKKYICLKEMQYFQKYVQIFEKDIP
jgi:hypothetical protein